MFLSNIIPRNFRVATPSNILPLINRFESCNGQLSFGRFLWKIMYFAFSSCSANSFTLNKAPILPTSELPRKNNSICKEKICIVSKHNRSEQNR